ncbi:hypothetical protein EIN_063030 [Entamoeba invadens IP1]|uniref:hypothetical protein n=1 Tax=Entamoeba invadens IP1 TaxID=370355 RepID=UPI0002C3FAC5|nr:hypothetical protein EIN_063030 [Entamoeba invadens IP1]ELP93588.1 hypothetical protein EIN_063030 [Entamoeba invadens IP1]|eukprot:XP_004260359.1 hypothetical protein EIN_063030 [Entamoeba invadens IP1]
MKSTQQIDKEKKPRISATQSSFTQSLTQHLTQYIEEPKKSVSKKELLCTQGPIKIKEELLDQVELIQKEHKSDSSRISKLVGNTPTPFHSTTDKLSDKQPQTDDDRIQKLLSNFPTKKEEDKEVTEEQNKIRAILKRAFNGQDYDLTFSKTEIDFMDTKDNAYECCVSVKVRLLLKESGVFHENYGSYCGVGDSEATALKLCQRKAKINGLFRTLQLFNVTTTEFHNQFRTIITE